MVHNNPGEKPYVTKYNDPVFLKSQGFTGAVPHWFVNCAIDYTNYTKKNILKKEERAWIDSLASRIDEKLATFHRAGIKVYPFTDFIVFPRSVWEKYKDEIVEDKNRRTHKPYLGNPRTRELLVAQIDGIFKRFPDLDGLTLRFGETYLHDAPFHVGGSPIRSGETGIEDHILFLSILREEICVKRNKKLFYRTWDFGYKFHTNPEYYLAVTNRIEPHPNLIFSIKYQQDDFHRMTPFNPTLGIGKHQQIVESQSRMEYYGKGAHPYYVAKGVIEGWPETKYEIEFDTHRFTGKVNDPSLPRGVKDVLPSGLIQGIVTWSNGGGWRGPYITHEIWTDLNTYVVSHWAQDTTRSEESLFYAFTDSLGFDPFNADIFRQIALLSVEGVRKGHCNSYTRNDVFWTRDQFFDASRNKAIVDEMLRRNLQEKVLAEKAEASAIWLQIEALSKQFACTDSDLLEAIRVSCSYGRIKYQLIEQMWIIMIEDGRYRLEMPADKQKIANAITRYDRLWEEWKKLKNSSKWCATLYTDLAFNMRKNGSIGQLVDTWRSRIQNN